MKSLRFALFHFYSCFGDGRKILHFFFLTLYLLVDSVFLSSIHTGFKYVVQDA